MSNNDRAGRKRSRWGGPPPAPQPAAADKTRTKPPVAQVSDEAALRALLASAEARQEERKQQEQQRRENSKDTNKKTRRMHDEKQPPPHDAVAGHYGPADNHHHQQPDTSSTKEPETKKQNPNFGLSGALTADASNGGNVYKGVVLKFQEPPEARTPNTQWRLYVFKGPEQLDILHISKQSAYLIGRNEDICDICVQHPSCSSQHAVLQYRAVPDKTTNKLNCQPYIMDLESTNGTFLNGVQIDAARYYQLKKGDVLKFGASTREYVLLTATAKSVK